MNREDFIFAIGYSGDSAIVDKGARGKYGKLDTSALLDKGLFRAAFCSALYSEEQQQLDEVIKRVNESCSTSIDSVMQLQRLYGVFSVPDNVNRINAL